MAGGSLKQLALEGDELGGAVKGNVPCEWCGEPSVGHLPIMRRVKSGKGRGGLYPSGMNVYFCRRHRGQAERSTEKAR